MLRRKQIRETFTDDDVRDGAAESSKTRKTHFTTTTSPPPDIEMQKTDKKDLVPTRNFNKQKSLVTIMNLRQEAQQKVMTSRFTFNEMTKYYIRFVAFPIIISLYYASAILFPADARSKAPLLLWTNGSLVKGENGEPMSLCPRESICSEGIFQIILISLSRLTAFASYVVMAHTFLSKMHCTIHAFSTSFIGTMVPLAKLHHVHMNTGKWYAGLAVLHAITHIIRWIIRGDMSLLGTQVGLSGAVGVVSIVMVIVSMTGIAKRFEKMTFESRFNTHWTFLVILLVALSLHTPRCRIITLLFSGLWFADWLYGYMFKTYRLDLVEFTPLPDKSGVQMLWRNPPGFQANSGEYVKVQLPWLMKGGNEWHPFSVYLHEETEEGLDEVLRKKYNVNNHRTYLGGIGKVVEPSKTALLLIQYQNEFASVGGKLHKSVQQVMKSTNMLQNTADLVETARSTGTYIFHLLVVFDEDGLDNPNKHVGVLRNYNDGTFFTKGSWNAEIVDCLSPKIDDVIIPDLKGLDGFIGTDLQEQLEKRGIETIILGGFRTNCAVESTMRTGYEMGFNVIALEDGTACTNQAEQDASVQNTFKMFSTPMTCSEASDMIRGITPPRLVEQFSRSDSMLEDDLLSKGPAIRSDLSSFIDSCMKYDQGVTGRRSSLILTEARHEIRSQYNTTQVFMVPAGDWTKQVYQEVTDDHQLRHCWVKGPYVSPYAAVSNFSNLVLIASGIGITPALGVMAQFKGNSRMKILMWSTRCPRMLKFFVSLFEDDATMAIIYYTGKETLSDAELKALSSSKNIFIQRSRPASMTDTVTTIITSIESLSGGTASLASSVSDIPAQIRNQWCLLYCGGSIKIRDMFSDYSREAKVKFEYELFDW